MSSTSTKIGHALAKGLGIKLENPEPYQDEVTRGESVLSVQTADTFVEQPPTTAEYLFELVPNGKQLTNYLYSLFPFIHWIGHYNLQWLAGDLVAGKSAESSAARSPSPRINSHRPRQESPSALSSCLRAWRTPNTPNKNHRTNRKQQTWVC